MEQPIPIGLIIKPLETRLREKLTHLKENDAMANQKTESIESPYLSPKELSHRWRCSRSSVDRLARRAGLTRLNLGEGHSGAVRYLRSEVVALEESLLRRKGAQTLGRKGRRMVQAQ